MTTQLIPVFNGTVSRETTLLCDARELHAFLGAGKRFASWITERIAEYEFIENQDYVIASQNWEAKKSLPTEIGEQRIGRGGHNRKDYHLTLDTAKELAMVERNEKGRQIRRYFIECEKQLRQRPGSPPAHPVKPVVKTRREEVYYENDLPVARRPIGEGEILMNPDSCIEHVMRSGFVIIPCDEVGKLTMDELWLMAEETKKLRDRVRSNYQVLASRYDF